MLRRWQIFQIIARQTVLFCLVLIAYCGLLPNCASSFETSAKQAFVYDLTNQKVLFEKHADDPIAPGSLSKLMTLYLAFEFIEAGLLSVDEKLPVSRHASAYGGATMFLDTSDRVTVKDLILGIIVLSANDASAVIAETLSPDSTEAGFARLMTSRAKQLGMRNSVFLNSNGFPRPGHQSTARDLGILGMRLINDFPEQYKLFSEQKFLFDGRAPANTRNRNPLLGNIDGADGLMTAHTNDSNYSLVGSVLLKERRIIFVLSGLDSVNSRFEAADALVRKIRFGSAWSKIIDDDVLQTDNVQDKSILQLLSDIENDLTLGSEQVVLQEDNLPKVGLSPPRSTVRPMLRPENLGSTKASELQKILDEVADSEDEETSQRSFSAAPLTQQEKDKFTDQVSRCWKIDSSNRPSEVTVTVAFEMTKAGKVVASSIELIAFTNGDIKDAEIVFKAGRRALLKCQKSGYELPVEKYDQWRHVEVKFDSSNMRKN